jgi:hypothetical protein
VVEASALRLVVVSAGAAVACMPSVASWIAHATHAMRLGLRHDTTSEERVRWWIIDSGADYW